ncbi:tether containing UBX domain for GLUT4-like isoform X3 [Physella acuta]|uniref:tether containing UBX domain for GLUT4-like isoform X3 n=1 Tax=Physella acuta TaxID=109671 RepID=UPI0027DAC9E8|nr:tether containing UBX domain for GLUT4-like isoform X3 [Physella acuta]
MTVRTRQVFSTKMAASFLVLCPNGRRQNVKVNANTKLLQILEEVCQRQGFIPPEEYKLVHGKQELDLSLSVRFSSLSNNAKLELIKAHTVRVEKEVTIALQLSSGERLQGSFKPNVTIWDMLKQLETKFGDYKDILTQIDNSKVPALHPVCIFMREEIIGSFALQAVTLKKLGLTAGKAIIRLLHRPVEETTLLEIKDNIEKERLKQAKLEEIAMKKNEIQLKDEIEKLRKTHGFAEELMETEETKESVNSAVTMWAETEGNTVNATEEHQEESHVDDNTKEEDITNDNSDAHHSTSQVTPQSQLLSTSSSLDLAPAAEQSTSLFSHFKFPEATRGMNLTGNNFESKKLENLQLCDRQVIIYHTDETMQSNSSSENIPDDFFEVTKSDIQILYRDLQNAVQQLEDQPLMTKAMKQAQTEALYDQYDHVVIRIHFPEKLTLQGLFKPREPVSALYDFVSDHLQVKDLNFYLYTSPPKEIIKDKNTSLASNHLAPAAVIYFGSSNAQGKHLKIGLKDMVKSRLEAEKVVARILKSSLQDASSNTFLEKSSHVSTTVQSGESKSSIQSKPTNSRTATEAMLSSSSQLPKWLKLGRFLFTVC